MYFPKKQWTPAHVSAAYVAQLRHHFRYLGLPLREETKSCRSPLSNIKQFLSDIVMGVKYESQSLNPFSGQARMGKSMRSVIFSKAGEKSTEELQNQFKNALEKQKAEAKVQAQRIHEAQLRAMKDLAATEMETAEKLNEVGRTKAADVFEKAQKHKERAMRVMEIMQQEARTQQKNLSLFDPKNLSKRSVASKGALAYPILMGSALVG